MLRRVCWVAAAAVVCLGWPGGCAAQADPWASLPFVDVLRFSSLPLEGSQAIAPPAGAWELSLTTGYFNVWQLTWHTKTFHSGLGLYRSPLTDEQIKILERNFPHDQFYHIDLEGTRTDMIVSRGLGDGVGVTLDVPWVEVGRPHWDGIAEDFHARFGLSDMGRELFPRGESAVYVRGRSGAIERLAGLDGSGLGDASLSLTGPAGRALGAEQRWAVAVEAPTGTAGTLRGSGGWDAGARWFATWGGDRRQLRVGVGYTYLDRGGSWLGVRRDNMWHGLVETHVPLFRLLTLRASARCDSSPLASFTDSDVGKPSFYWTVGVLAPTGHATWIAFDAGENYGSQAEVPDFSFHLQLGTRLGR